MLASEALTCEGKAMFPTSFGEDLPRQPRSSSGFLAAMHLQAVLRMRSFFLADSSDSLGGY
jgi:hypothetical protein